MLKKIVLALLTLLLTVGIIPAARAALEGGTYLPQVYNQPLPTATPSPTATRTPTVTPTATQVAVNVEIIEVKSPGTLEETVVIQNKGSRAADLTDWKLTARINPPEAPYYFPEFELAAGKTVQVWTKSGTDTATNLYMDRNAAIWDKEGNCIRLRDDESPSQLVDEYCY